jgi:hypothetical protein
MPYRPAPRKNYEAVPWSMRVCPSFCFPLLKDKQEKIPLAIKRTGFLFSKILFYKINMASP